LPALYIAFALFVEWVLLVHKTQRGITGLCIVALGSPAFCFWRRHAEARVREA
jgi:hypothetical protein